MALTSPHSKADHSKPEGYANGINDLPSSWQSIPGLPLTGRPVGKYDHLGFDSNRRCYALKCRKNEAPSILNFTLDTGLPL